MALINVPLASQSLGQTNASIRGNFSVIGAAFIVDHVDYNTSGQGKHNQVTFPVQGAQPTFLTGEEGLYNFLNATTNKNELYVHKQLVAGTVDIPFTASKMSNYAFASCNSGWSYLPSGLLIKWGSIAANSPAISVNTTTISGGPAFQQVFTVMVTSVDTGTATNFICGQRSAVDLGTGIFTAWCANNNGSTSINYLVIGV